MSKESRRRQRAASQQSTTTSGSPRPAQGPSTGSAAAQRPSASPTGTARAGRRERARASAVKPSFLERNRNLFLGAGVIAVIAIVGVGLFAAASQPAYACSNIWEPSATPTPGQGASPQPGYAQPDMGQGHVANGTSVAYTYCPPASGRHYNSSSTGPIQPRVYGPNDSVIPEGWVHNLEHGAVVVLYKPDGPGGTEEGQAALRAFFDDFPASPVCGFEPGTNVGPVFAPFEDMAWPYAALVWGRVLPLQDLDRDAILAFDQAYGEKTNPEDFCPDKRVSPSPSTSAEPNGSAEPSASPAASPSESAAPSASPAASPSPSAS